MALEDVPRQAWYEDYWSYVDCDDSNPNAHPGAEETPYDGIDADCYGDADEYDWDRDGDDAAAWGGTDCRDDNRNVHPGAPEWCGNGLDDDCDGQIDEAPCGRATTLDGAPTVGGAGGSYGLGDVVTFLEVDGAMGFAAQQWTTEYEVVVVPSLPAGTRSLDEVAVAVIADVRLLGSASDLTGDGVEDLYVTTGREVGVMAGPLTGERSYAYAAWGRGGYDGGVLGDVTGDGVADVLVDEAMYEGPLGAESSRDPTATLHRVDPVARPDAGDLDGDGIDETLVYDTSDAQVVARAGPLTGERFVDHRDSPLPGGRDAVGVGDIDGDGLPEVAVGTSYGDEPVVVYLDPLAPSADDAVLLDVTDVGYVAGFGGAGDLDGDGRAELWVAWEGALVFAAHAPGTYTGQADAVWVSPTAGDVAAAAVNAGRDGDGDGVPDLLLGFPWFGDSRGAVVFATGAPIAAAVVGSR